MLTTTKISLTRGLSALSGLLTKTSTNTKLSVAVVLLGGAILAAAAAGAGEVFIKGCENNLNTFFPVDVTGLTVPKEYAVCQNTNVQIQPVDFTYDVYGYNNDTVEIIYQDGADGLLKRTRIGKGQNTVLPLFNNFKNFQVIIGFKGVVGTVEGTKAVMTVMLFGSNTNVICNDDDAPSIEIKDGEKNNYYNIYKKGTISGILAGEVVDLSDDCVTGADGEYLREYFCEAGSAAIHFKDNIKCEFGCREGACLKLDNLIEELLQTQKTNFDLTK